MTLFLHSTLSREEDLTQQMDRKLGKVMNDFHRHHLTISPSHLRTTTSHNFNFISVKCHPQPKATVYFGACQTTIPTPHPRIPGEMQVRRVSSCLGLSATNDKGANASSQSVREPSLHGALHTLQTASCINILQLDVQSVCLLMAASKLFQPPHVPLRRTSSSSSSPSPSSTIHRDPNCPHCSNGIFSGTR